MKNFFTPFFGRTDKEARIDWRSLRRDPALPVDASAHGSDTDRVSMTDEQASQIRDRLKREFGQRMKSMARPAWEEEI
jgi:hypothetical protein